ncbi:hypothetical protein MYX84_14290, partial [Acidobacteria bacterium AH-259-O06]|nr:hypothetical protein [Acidobacteria bacterium AH-259-O06]
PCDARKKETDEISILLTAEVNSEGELVLSGQDLGVKELSGDMDYEYLDDRFTGSKTVSTAATPPRSLFEPP